MADRHKSKPKAVRMPDGLEAWYRQHATETGRTLNAALVAALEDYRNRHEAAPLSVGGLKIPVVIDERQPPGTIGLVSAWREGGEVKASAAVVVNVAPDPGCPHPKARVNKGLCGACGTNVGK